MTSSQRANGSCGQELYFQALSAFRYTAELRRSQAAATTFAEAFDPDPPIDMHRLGRAIATFERTLPIGRSKFDAFLAGRSSALTDSAVRGLHLFRTTARCMNCHSGPTFSDDAFHDVGLGYYGRKLQDLAWYDVTRAFSIST